MVEYFLHLANIIGIYIILTISMNLIVGYTGLFALAHAAYYGIGAYTSALVTLNLGLPVWAGIALGSLNAAFFGFILAIPTLRLRGDYLCIATVGFVEIIRAVFMNWDSVTRGPFGLPNLPRPRLMGFEFATRAEYLFLVMGFVIFTVIAVRNILNSRIGRSFKAVRDDEIAATAMGVNVFLVKALALTIAAFFCGIAGALFAHYITYVDPSTFGTFESIMILCMAVLGGMGSISGSVVGPCILITLPEILRNIGIAGDFSLFRQVFFGVLLIAVMVFRPTGIMGTHEFQLALFKKVRAASAKSGKGN